MAEEARNNQKTGRGTENIESREALGSPLNGGLQFSFVRETRGREFHREVLY